MKRNNEEINMKSNSQSDHYTSIDGGDSLIILNETNNFPTTRSQTKKLNGENCSPTNFNLLKEIPSIDLVGTKKRTYNRKNTSKETVKDNTKPITKPNKQLIKKVGICCSICKEELGGDNVVCCFSCNSKCHADCLILKNKNRNSKRNWKCDTCINNLNYSTDQFQDCQENIEFEFLEINGNREPTIKDLQLSIISIQDSMNFMNKSFEEMIKKQKSLANENHLLRDSLKKQHEDIIILKKEAEIYRTELNKRDQKEISSNIILSNLPLINTTREKHKIFADVVTKLEVTPDINTNIPVVEIVRNNGKHDYIIPLNNKESVENIIKKRKTHKFYINNKLEILSDVFSTGYEQPIQEKDNIQRIYVSEQLTKFNSKLLKKSKLLRSFGYTFIWHKFGKIFARKTNTSRIILITSLTMVDDLISKCCSEISGLNNINIQTQSEPIQHIH